MSQQQLQLQQQQQLLQEEHVAAAAAGLLPAGAWHQLQLGLAEPSEISWSHLAT
jgi:hypothetical protein